MLICTQQDAPTSGGKRQPWRDGEVESDRVLREMRTRIRRALGITDAEGEVTSAEAVAIFTICYVQFYTVTTPGDVRRPRIMHDHHDFIDPRKPDGLPYYVMAIHDLGQVPEGLPSAFVEAYVDSTELHTLQDAPGYDAMAAAQAEKLYALMRRPRPKQ